MDDDSDDDDENDNEDIDDEMPGLMPRDEERDSDDEDEELPELIDHGNETDSEDEEEVPARTTRSGRVIRAKRYDEYQYYTSEAYYYAAVCQSFDLDDIESK